MAELQALLGPVQPGQRVQAVPGGGTHVPLWILGSSLYGAQVAAHFGLPYAFASHFAPDALMQALQVYRARFQPSAQLARPHAMVGVNVIAADTDAEARRLFTSAQQSFTNIFRGTRGKLLPPIDDIEAYWSPAEKAQASAMLACSFVGSAATVRATWPRSSPRRGADELMVAGAIHDHGARLRSYEILAEIAPALVARDRDGVTEATPPDSKLTTAKQRWAEQGRGLTGPVERPAADRLPPGQHLVRDWPVLDLGVHPTIDPARWTLRVFGAVRQADPGTGRRSRAAAAPRGRPTSTASPPGRRYDNAWDGVSTRHRAGRGAALAGRELRGAAQP